MPKYKTKLVNNILSEFKEYLYSLIDGTPYSRFHWVGTNAIADLENKFRHYYGCEYAIAYSSSTNALSSIALMLDIKKGEEVITTTQNWGSSIAGLLSFRRDIVVRYAEVNDELNIYPRKLKKLIRSKTKVIWVCDYGGVPHDMYAIREVCDNHSLLYISDASQSFGRKINGKPASSLADVWVTSIGSGKPLSAGEGAIILTNDALWYEKMLLFQHPYRAMIELGLEKGSELYPINGRMNPFSAIVGNYLFDNYIYQKSMQLLRQK